MLKCLRDYRWDFISNKYLMLTYNEYHTHFQNRMEDHKAKCWWLLILNDRKDGKIFLASNLSIVNFYSCYISLRKIFKYHNCISYLLLME